MSLGLGGLGGQSLGTGLGAQQRGGASAPAGAGQSGGGPRGLPVASPAGPPDAIHLQVCGRTVPLMKTNTIIDGGCEWNK
eukprot:2231627-Pyramimonas_sp.AAC.1